MVSDPEIGLMNPEGRVQKFNPLLPICLCAFSVSFFMTRSLSSRSASSTWVVPVTSATTAAPLQVSPYRHVQQPALRRVIRFE